jgi:kynurenine formamidase
VSPSERFTEIAARVRNWGRWGDEDQLGTINLIDDAARRRGGECVRSGKAFSLSLPLSERKGIQTGIIPGRLNPVRTMTHLNTPLSADADWICSSEDIVVMGTQAATHWDALSHVSYGGFMWNGYPATSVTVTGATRCGIHLVKTLVSRGVLLDVARAKGLEVLEEGYAIQPDDLDAACELAKVSVEPGDVVLVRTGQTAHLGLRKGTKRDLNKYVWPTPGLTMSTAGWFRDRDVAAVATDTLPLEVFPGEEDGTFLPVHLLHLVEMGMTQGQNWVLDDLADDCAEDGIYTFLLDASPLPFVDGTGSPINPVALK